MAKLNNFSFKTKEFIYQPVETGVYPIREDDWSMVKRHIERIIPAKRILQDLASIFLCVFISGGFAILGLTTSSSVPNWVYPTTWAILICSLILSITFFILNKQQKETIETTVTTILEEMNLIEKKYVNPKKIDNS